MDLTGSQTGVGGTGKRSSLRLLFWLKWRLTTRGYQRNSTALVGVILGVLVFLPLVGLAAVGSYMAYKSAEPPVPQQVLQGVLLGAYLFWIVSPMMGFALSDSFDVTKLFVYPVSVREILFGAVAGSILDFPVLFLLPSLLSALIAFAPGGVGTLLTALALFLFLAHTLSLGQSIVLATSGMLRSRRYRDLLMVVFPLIWMVYYVVQEMMRRGSLRIDWQAIFQSKTWEAINFLPPGMAARAVLAANQGDLAVSAAWCGLLLAITVATVLMAAALIQKVYAGDTDVIRVRASKETPGHEAQRSARGAADSEGSLPLGIRLSPVAEAVYRKEARYMARDPSFKAALMNLIYTLLVAVFMVMPRSDSHVPMRWMVWPASCVILLSEMRFFFNLFGTEGAAASLFFLFPASRRDMLIGKNVVYLLAAGIINVVLTVIICAVAQSMDELPYLLFWMLLSTCFFVAAGDLMSVLFPMRVVVKGWKVRQTSAGQGCAFGFLYLGVSFATLLALAPVAAALLVPRLWLGIGWLALSLPLAVGYVAGALFISLKIAERLLLERELQVMQKLGAEE